MSIQDTPQELWGGETTKAVANFPVSGERVPVSVVRWLGRIKGAAARVNADLGLLDADLAQRIAAAGDEVAEGKHEDQFPIDVFQTGSGTSSNMNATEVLANLAGEGAHPNDHVNMGQSSNDVFPSAVHLAALDEVTRDLLPAMGSLQAALEAKAKQFADVVKAGRTHLMDAVPVTLGQEFGGYAAQVRLGVQRVEATLGRVGQIPLGGTATGTGLNTHTEFAERVRAVSREEHRLTDPGAGEQCSGSTPASRSRPRPIPSRRRLRATRSSRHRAPSRPSPSPSPRLRTTSASWARARVRVSRRSRCRSSRRGARSCPGRSTRSSPRS